MKSNPKNRQIFDGAHEAVIDKEILNIVRRLREGRGRVMPILSVMLF